MLMCNDGKGRLSEADLRVFDLFVSGRNDTTPTDSDSSEEESYICPCGKSFKRKAPYQRHMDISHSNVESYHCSTCGKTFGKRNILTMHMSIHKTTDENKERFDEMERRSTRSKARTAIVLSSSKARTAIVLSSPLRVKKPEVVYKTRSKDKSTTSRQTRSTSRESKKSRSTSRETVSQVKKSHVNYRTRSASKGKNRSAARIVSEEIVQATHLKHPCIPATTAGRQVVKEHPQSDIIIENNNVLTYTPVDKTVSSVNDKQSTLINECNLSSKLPTKSIDLNASQDSDKENNDLSPQLKSKLDIPENILEQFLLPDVHPVRLESRHSNNLQSTSLDNVKTNPCLVNKDNYVLKLPTNKTSLPATETVNTTDNGVTTINNNTIQVTSANENKFHKEKKNNTQTIVIVIREAKPVKQKSADECETLNNKLKSAILPSQTQNITVSQSQFNNVKRHTSAAVQSMAVAQPQVIAAAQQLRARPMQVAQPMSSAQNTALSAAAKMYSVAMPAVLGPNTAGVLSRSDVPRTVASVAPSFINNAPRAMAVRNESIETQRTISSTMASLSGDGDTTESDDGADEYPSTRKSARLDGKVPAWKKVVDQPATVYNAMDESRNRKRKVGRPRVGGDEDDIDLNGAAAELLGHVVDDVALDDDELTDMSNQLFSRRQRMFRDEHTCEICGRSFSTEKYLQMHSSLHGAATPARNLVAENYKANEYREQDGFKSSWTCKICNKVFAQNSSFKNHMRTHSDERPFVCDICSIGFKERYHLKKHMLFKHSDELKEKCQFCGKRFKDSTAVRAHERIHSDHRPYHCRRCGKAFKTSECLWHHENRSKTCGALGGPPLPPLPKKGRVSRKTKPNAPIPTGPVHVVQSVQPQVSAQAIKSEQDNMLELVQQIIQSENKKAVRSAVQNAISQQQHCFTQSMALPSMPAAQMHVVPSTAGQCVTTTMHNMAPVMNTHPTIAQLQPSAQQHQQQTQTVKIAQGQQLVFSVPMIKEGNHDAAAQVTKAILDAISNTTGQMRGVNIQKTIQCAVNNVQEVIDVTKTTGQSYQQNGQPMVATAGARNQSQVAPVLQSHLPAAVPAQGLHAEPQYYNVVSTSIPTINRSAAMLFQQPSSQPHRPVYSSNSASRPYTVSILPPISSVAQALKSKELDLADAEDEYYSSDSDDDDGEYEAEVTSATASILPDGLHIPTTRPVATVQPLRRVESDRSSSTDSDMSLTVESTSETYVVQPFRNKQSNYTCPKCQKGFAVPSAYHKHLLKHDEVRPFRCETCDIGFKLKVHLKKHNLYRHSDEYPCECSICGKRFKDSSAVRLHERIHSEDRPFECGCGKSFKTKENLWGHQNRKMCPYAGYPPPPRDDGAPPPALSPQVQPALSNNQNIAMTIQSYVSEQNTFNTRDTLYSSNSQKPADFHALQVSHPSIMVTKIEDQPIKQEPDSAVQLKTQLPSFDSFTSLSQTCMSMSTEAMIDAMQGHLKKESMAEQCPTIHNLLKKGPRSVTKLPGIQQLFKQHIKPPPPYPGHLTPPRFADMSPAYSYQSSSSPIPSPQQSIPSSPVRSPYSRQSSQSPIASPNPNLNMMLNIDQLYTSALTKDPFWRSPNMSSRKGSELASPSTDYCPVSIGVPKSPRSPRNNTAMSPAPSHCSEGMGQMFWDDETERKPVLTQWQNTDSETLFMELSTNLSTNMLNQI